MIITPAIKDDILNRLVNNGLSGQTITSKTFEYDYLIVQSILRQFSKRGLINSHDFSGLRYRVQVELDAHDFVNRGGFTFEEEVFRNNFTKLELELAKLEGELPKERFNNIMNLVSTISAAVSAYSSFNSGS
ncbi:hypothetical protein N180_02890 [Pedobacter antarcticus 4BY]|uniref:Uncharacterized protein n=2 Tax=Pedobacter antarcticus TaxID=34086 RepID=A0A081PKI8_9SPHI|nr:hypothetical protein [Pedobacter antarcticus]KEQ31211.1 hypothetical protein N180_02890 [Pedobacter antarcticus 4BY]SFE55083.1 hypothetical protein SAMN03003324_00865 [Pedobacter antarcticus]